MRTFRIVAIFAIVAVGGVAIHAQQQFRQPNGPPGYRGNNPQGNQNRNEKPEVKLPDDPVLLELHKNFVLAAEKLAGDYERKGQGDKARACYDEILRLVPTYTPAAEKLATIKQREAIAEHKTFEVLANKGWQDAGVSVIPGKPISIKSSGSWTMRMTYTLSPDGIEIPKELRNFPLGALVGKIASSPTDEEADIFLIGASKSFTADREGRLYLRMYDSDTDDNLGKVSAYIEGTYKK